MEIYQTNCYGCGACVQACPHQAVRLLPGEDGACLPQVEPDLCSGCQLCRRVCPDWNPQPRNRPTEGYAAVCTDREMLKHAASGGAFSALAKAVLEQGGAVFGCAMPEQEGCFVPRHEMVERQEDLWRLQGSKYAQSNTSEVYRQVKQQLKTGRPVLFSGTPCQVDGLYGFLQTRNQENLWTVDLICHGVPSGNMLEEYLHSMEARKKIRVLEFAFRGKSAGWGQFFYRMKYRTSTGQIREIQRPASRSSFYWLFLKGAAYRENCYACPYAGMYRAADLTIGDWWGIRQEYPAYLGENADQFREEEGVSCVLVNTQRGREALDRFGCYLRKRPTDPEAIARGNKQLRQPQEKPAVREDVMTLYRKSGYAAVEKWYARRLGLKGRLYGLLDWLRYDRKGF